MSRRPIGPDGPPREAPAPHGPPPRGVARHGAGFVVAGLAATGTDLAVTSLTTRVLGLPPEVGRLVAIAVAIVVGWLAHRRLTFAVATPPTVAEFGRYVAVAWVAAAVNYTLYVLVLAVVPATPPEAALIVASAGAMAASYLGMRFGVFRSR
jgi:putative flippase GtrA